MTKEQSRDHSHPHRRYDYIYTEARLAFRTDNEGNIRLAIHAMRKEPQVDYPYMGYKLSPEEKEQLLAISNLGKTIEVTPKSGEPFAAYVSIDPHPRTDFRHPCSPIRRTVPQWGRPSQHSCPIPHVELTYAMDRQGQSFRLILPYGAKDTEGLKPPGYSKTVLRTENAAATPPPSKYLRLQ